MYRHNPPVEFQPELHHVMVEVKGSPPVRESAMAAMGAVQPQMDTGVLPQLPGIDWDATFPPVEIRRAEAAVSPAMGMALAEMEEPTFIVRGVTRGDTIPELATAVAFHPQTYQIFADPRIEPLLICPGSAPMGTDADVEALLCVPRLQQEGMNGEGVLVAIVDSGFNMQYLASKGKTPSFDASRSWTHNPAVVPGAAPVDHGTMCAYDACIAAPSCTLLDIVLLGTQWPFSALLSDAVTAYNHLLRLVRSPGFFEEFRGLVVNNSWGMFHPSWDSPVGHPANYSDNPGHPFNIVVSTLERYGADIIFAAGNCGFNCPDGRCQGATASAIYGANSHPQVLSVAGVDVSKTRVGYSSTGPGRLSASKPDLCGYTHFAGSGVYVADGGTSAAAPVVAGVAAAVRTTRPAPGTPPAALRSLLVNHCDPKLPTHSNEYGWGVVSGCTI